MPKTHTIVTAATRIPVPGGKLIEELFGKVSTGTTDISVAHMVAPAGWGEPAQTPQFAELTIMVRGCMRVEVGEEIVELRASQAIRVEPGVRVCYKNPYPDDCEYFAICVPAFTMEKAHREPE